MTTFSVTQNNNQNVWQSLATKENAKRQNCCQRFTALPVINQVVSAIIWLVKKIFPCLFKNEVIVKPATPLLSPKHKVRILTVKLQNVPQSNTPATKPVGVKILLSTPEPKSPDPITSKSPIAPIISTNNNVEPTPSRLIVNTTPNTPPPTTRTVIIANTTVFSPTSPIVSPKSLPSTPNVAKHKRHLSDSGMSWNIPITSTAGIVSPINLTSPKASARLSAPAQQSPRKELTPTPNSRLLNASIPDLLSSPDTSEVSGQEGFLKLSWVIKTAPEKKRDAVLTLSENELLLYQTLKKPHYIDLTAWLDMQKVVNEVLNERILEKLLIDHPSWKAQVDNWTTISKEEKVWLIRLYELYSLSPKCVPQIGALHSNPKIIPAPSEKSPELLLKWSEIHTSLESVEELNITNQKINNSLDAISFLPNLTRLVLEKNNLNTPPDIRKNQKLKMLKIVDNPLTTAPIVRFNSNLEILYLVGNRFTLPPDVSSNEQLKELVISRNQLTAPPDVRDNTNLEILNLNDNGLEQAPNVSCNPLLQYLHLNGNKIAQAPDLSQNKELLYLNITPKVNEYSSLKEPPSLGQNTKLKVLILDNNELTKIDVTQNIDLEVLSLVNNYFLNPPDISKNPLLRQLSLAGNFLERIDISKNPQLQQLDLATNCYLQDDPKGKQLVKDLQKAQPKLEIGNDTANL